MGTPCVYTSISKDRDYCAFAPKIFGKLPKKYTISKNYEITNKRLSCVKELAQNVSFMKSVTRQLWLQACGALLPNCKQTQAKLRFFLHKKYELLLPSLCSNHTMPFSLSSQLLSSDPCMLPEQRVDRGAIRFILSGANVMCPGLTSPGAKLIDMPKDSIVVS